MERKVFSSESSKYMEEITASAVSFYMAKLGSLKGVKFLNGDEDAENWFSIVYMPPRKVEPNNAVVYDDGMSIHLNIQKCGTFCCRLFGKILVESASIKLAGSNSRTVSLVNKIQDEAMLHYVLEWIISRRLCEGLGNAQYFESFQLSKQIPANKNRFTDTAENCNHLRNISKCSGILNDTPKWIRCEGCKQSMQAYKQIAARKRKRTSNPISKFASIAQLPPPDQLRRSNSILNQRASTVRSLTGENKRLREIVSELGISADPSDGTK